LELNVSIEKDRYPKISKSLVQAGAKFPECLSECFAHILQCSEALWGGKDALAYFNSLLFEDVHQNRKDWLNRADHSDYAPNSDRAHRQGFPIEAVNEIVFLKQLHQFLYASQQMDLCGYSFSKTKATPDIPGKKDADAAICPVSVADRGIVQADAPDRESPAGWQVNSFATGRKIIVVEDDPAFAQGVIDRLEAIGGRVEYFRSAEDALLHANVQYADYYIVGCRLGGKLSGMQLLKLLRLKREQPINAVLVTDATQDTCDVAHCDWPVHYKPVDIQQLFMSLIAPD
jgi:CheY-like chemotaxis protein